MKKIIITLSLIFGNIFVFGNDNHSIVEKGDYYNNNSQYARFWSEVTLTCKKMDSKKSSMIKTKYYGTDDPDYFGSRSLDESQGITYLLYFKECIIYQAPDEYYSEGEEEKLYNVGVRIYSEWENKIKEKNINLEKINNKDIVIKTNDGADIFIFFGEKSEISFKKYGELFTVFGTPDKDIHFYKDADNKMTLYSPYE